MEFSRPGWAFDFSFFPPKSSGKKEGGFVTTLETVKSIPLSQQFSQLAFIFCYSGIKTCQVSSRVISRYGLFLTHLGGSIPVRDVKCQVYKVVLFDETCLFLSLGVAREKALEKERPS